MTTNEIYQVPTVDLAATHAMNVMQFANYTAYLAITATGQVGSIVLRANDLVKLSAPAETMAAKIKRAQALGVFDPFLLQQAYAQFHFHDTLIKTLGDELNQPFLQNVKVAARDEDEFDVATITGVAADGTIDFDFGDLGEQLYTTEDKLAELQLGSILKAAGLPQTLAAILDYPLVDVWTKDDDNNCLMAYLIAQQPEWLLCANLDEFGYLGSVALVKQTAVAEVTPGSVATVALHQRARKNLKAGKFDPFGVWDKVLLPKTLNKLPVSVGQIVTVQIKADETFASDYVTGKVAAITPEGLTLAFDNNERKINLADVIQLRLSGIDEIQEQQN